MRWVVLLYLFTANYTFSDDTEECRFKGNCSVATECRTNLYEAIKANKQLREDLEQANRNITALNQQKRDLNEAIDLLLQKNDTSVTDSEEE